MSEYQPQSPRFAYDEDRPAPTRPRSRMKVRVGGQVFEILRYWSNGFALDPSDAPRIRGRVDIYDGTRHVCQALVVTSREEEGERIFEYKYSTPASENAPLVDFVREEPAAAAPED